MRSGIFIFLSLVAFLGSCEDPVAIGDIRNDSQLVVEAYLTDSAVFNTVKISRSSTFSSNYPFEPFNEPVVGAEVVVYSNDHSDTLIYKESEPGLYLADKAGEPGKSYYMEITAADTLLCRSEVEELLPTVPVAGISVNLEEVTNFVNDPSSNYLKKEHYFFQVQANIQDPPGPNYYMWRAHGIFLYYTLPVGDSPCMYCFCWAPEYPLMGTVNVLNDQHVDGQLFSRKVASVLYDRDTEYLVRVYQYSLNKSGYEYWNRVSQQQSNSGTIFDTTPARIRGNIRGKNNEEVLGFFTVASVSSNKILIDRKGEAELAGIRVPNLIEPIKGDCRPLYNGSTHIRPHDFNE